MADTMQSIIPQFDPNRGFRVWNESEIYTGQNGTGTMVPNVGDAVIKWNSGWYRVIDVDQTTYLSSMVYVSFPEQNDTDNLDILLGVGPGYASETFRMYLNTSVKPFTLEPDDRLHSYGMLSHHYKVFLGTDISASGKVISAYYDSNNSYVSENIPFELAARSDVDNYSIKTPMGGFCTMDLPDGQVVTLVAYSSTGGPVGINKLLIRRTAFIRKSEANQNAITGISLYSPWLADDLENTLRIPMNLPLEALNLRGRLHYTSGLERDIPVDGSKMILSGLENYISTINGQEAPLILSYRLGPNEAATNADQVGNKYFITVPYKAISTEVAGTYSVKLYPILEWIDEYSGWGIEWYLYNLDRGDFYNVTSVIEMGVNSAIFDPLLYGTKQYLTVAVDMQKVDPRLAQYRHVQTIAITLMNNGLVDQVPYYLEFSPGQNPVYGGNYTARVSYQAAGAYQIDISQGLTTLTDWLQALYYPTEPLYDPSTETGPLAPTHFVLNVNGYRTEYDLSSWNTVLNYPTGGKPGKGAMIEWIRKISGATLQLGCSPLKIFHDTSSSGSDSETLVFYPAWATAVGDTLSTWFGSSASTLSLKLNGKGVADWTGTYDPDTGDVITPPIEFTWADGVAVPATTFEVMVEIDSRYVNGSNYLYPDCVLNQWITMSGQFDIPVKMSGWISTSAFIAIRISVRDKNNPTNTATGVYKITNQAISG